MSSTFQNIEFVLLKKWVSRKTMQNNFCFGKALSNRVTIITPKKRS